MDTIDLKKQHKQLYQAKETPAQVMAPDCAFLAIDGVGRPGGETYQQAIQTLYSTAYTMKFALKGAGVLDFKIPNLECLWLSHPGQVSVDEWKWRLLIRVPDAITVEHVQESRAQLLKKKGIDASNLRLIRWKEGPSIQILHIGPYDDVADSYQTIEMFAQTHELQLGESGHEVYLSDPRQTAPEKLKTIIRIPLKSS
jgi:hypothetical protein